MASEAMWTASQPPQLIVCHISYVSLGERSEAMNIHCKTVIDDHNGVSRCRLGIYYSNWLGK